MSDQPRPTRPTQAQQALAKLAQAASHFGAQAYAVGGYVRDLMLGTPTRDVDVLVTACVREIADHIGSQPGVAVVTLREQEPAMRLVFSDRSHIDLSLPRGAQDQSSDHRCAPNLKLVREDLRRRDFTINAMAVPLVSLESEQWRRQVIDPTGGSADLAQRVLRATGPEVWQDDPLRLLRALRLAAQLGLEIEETTESGLRQQRRLLGTVTPERIRDELFALLAHPEAATWLERAAELGLLFEVIPELESLHTLAQGGYHHLDAWRHSLAVVRETQELALRAAEMSAMHRQRIAALLARPVGGDRPRLALLKLAALLHDLGKPATLATEADGRVHFYGHDTLGATMARAVGERLRLARRELQYLETVVGSHMLPCFLAQQQEVSRRAAHRFFRRTREYAPDALLVAWADRRSARGAAVAPGYAEHVERIIRWLLGEWLDRGALSHPEPPVGARAIMRRYQLEPGPTVGALVARLTRKHAERPFVDAEEAWAYLDRLARRCRAKRSEVNDGDAERQPSST